MSCDEWKLVTQKLYHISSSNDDVIRRQEARILKLQDCDVSFHDSIHRVGVRIRFK